MGVSTETQFLTNHRHYSMKGFVCLLFLGTVLTAQLPYAPAPYQKEAPKPFAYEYGGAEEYGRHFAKTETQDEYGVVNGEYSIELPDGRTQVVTYHADHENGYVADVKYIGDAIPYVAPAPHHGPLVHAGQPVFHG